MPHAVKDNKSQKDADRIIRDWARNAGVEVTDKGALPQRVRQAWIEAHEGLNNVVIGHDLYLVDMGSRRGRWDRVVKVLCYRCAKVHQHGGPVGKRLTPEENHRVAHCSGVSPYDGGYYFEDELEITENEKAMAAANDAL